MQVKPRNRMIIHLILDCIDIVRQFQQHYAHTNRFCVVKENIKPEVLKVQTQLARSVH